MKPYKLEACVETLDQCRSAEKRGADRVELCEHLDQDGLTPDHHLIKSVSEKLEIPVRVMIRPHSKGFFYSEEDLRRMKQSITFCKAHRIEGVVFGVTSPDGSTLDVDLTQELASHAAPLKVTIHKALDACNDPLVELWRLRDISEIDAVLTSGSASTAERGMPVLREMIKVAADRLDIIVCGKVTQENIASIHEKLGSNYYHGKKIVGSLV